MIAPLLEQLINIESVTPFDNGCQTVIEAELIKQGFRVEPLNAAPVSNLWATQGTTDDGPLLVFAGHTDVVPEGELSQWQRPPYQAVIEGDNIYGRGACDMKGALCAMIDATSRFLKKHPNHKGQIGYLITSGEEGDDFDLGTPFVMEHLNKKGINIDYCVIGEPSSTNTVGDVVKIGRRGSLTANIQINGIQGHVAYPSKALNPIHAFSPALAELSQMRFDEGNECFDPTTFQVTNINSGTGAGNVIPGSLNLQCNFRYSTEVTDKNLISIVETLIKEKHQLNASFQWRLNGMPFLTKQGNLIDAVKKAIKQHTKLNTEISTTGGTSDGRFIAPYGVQVVELGAINDCIHKVDEYTSIKELHILSNIYESICNNLLLK